MNVTQKEDCSDPWAVHRDTLESLDPIAKMVAESYIKLGKWKIIE